MGKGKLSALVISMVLIALSFGYVWGLFTYRNEIFPLNIYRDLAFTPDSLEYTEKVRLRAFFDYPSPPENYLGNDCPLGNLSKLTDLAAFIGQSKSVDIGQSISVDRILWGDSLIEYMYDPRIYGLEGWVSIGHGGQRIQCAVAEVDYIIALDPNYVVIYLGGNDSDHLRVTARYPASQVGLYMDQIVSKLLQNGITPIIHQLHLGPTLKRNLEYTAEVNDLYRDISEKYQLLLIPPVEKFADVALGTGKGLTGNGPGSGAKDENERITKDGEHLWPLGYAIWAEHLKIYLDLIPAGQ